MAGRSSVLNGLKSSPKGQLCYEEKWKKENMWKCLRQDSLQRVVEEHYPRQRGAETASGAEEPSALGLIGKELKEYARGDRGKDLNPDPLRFPNTAVVAPGRRGSKEGEEAAHSCSQSLSRVQPEATYHPREVALEQEYIQCERDVWWREEERKQSELVQRAEQIGVQERQLEEDHHSELLDAVQHAREREMEKRGKQQQLEEKLWVERQSEIDARLLVYRRQQLIAHDSLKTMEQEKREFYSRLWSELYSLLQTHLKARDAAVQACRDITRLVGVRAKVDHLEVGLLKRVKDARGNLTEETHQSLLGEVHVFDGAVQHLVREVVSVNAQVEREEEGKRAAEEQRKKEEEEEERRRKEAEKLAAQPQPATPPSSVLSASTASSDVVTNPSVLAEYNRLLERRKNTEKTVEVFVDTQDPNLKGYRFNLQKAVNTPINSISIQSASHIKDKVQRLCSLLAGRPVEVVGKRVSVATHPQALDYCRSLLAKKLVGQGEKQVSSHFEAAFPTAAVALGVWSEHPDIGDLLLASFYHTCPILVPLPIPTPPKVTEGEYKRLLGYSTSNNVMEDDDKFLKRMSGVVRLFAAMVQCPAVIWGQRNPFGVEHGWKWFALVLNTAPLPGITATAIFDFLEVAGHALMNTYGVQFRKLLRVLVSHYLPKIEAVTPPSQKGPITRLKQFLESCIQSGSVPTPKGMLPFEFWKGR